MSSYKHVQFIGYAIPSTPRITAEIGGDNPNFIKGKYVGIDPGKDDIQARIALTMNVIGQTIESGKVDKSPLTLKIFVMPEFTFRGTQGAYSHASDSFDDFRLQFAKRVGVRTYRDWLFVFGTIVNTEDYVRGDDKDRDRKAKVREGVAVALADAWQFGKLINDQDLENYSYQALRSYTKYCHAHPIYEVTDRSYIVAGGEQPDPVYPEGLSVEKKYISNEDFVLNLHNAFPEDDDGYPDIAEDDGENKKTAFDSLSIFTIKGIKFGLEICLDHWKARLRCYRKPDTDVVQIQLVPSCGMQIQEKAVIAGAGGYVFNCDGQYGGRDLSARPGVLDSIWTGEESQQAHSELTQVATPCTGNDPTCHMPQFEKPAATVDIVTVKDWTAPMLYAYGAGEVHVYTSLPVPPPAAGS